MIDKVKMFDIPVDALTMSETLSLISEKIDAKEFMQHVVVNAGKIVQAEKSSRLKQAILDSDIINADGQAVVWASRLLGKPLPERVAGIDLMLNLVKLAYEKHYKCYFFGAKEEVVNKVCSIFSKKYSDEIIGGFRNGYFSEAEEEKIVADIAKTGSDMLFVAMSSPQKEIFVNKYKDRLNVAFVMGVGGSFDVVAGVIRRAPLWMQKIGLEWFYRFLQEPKRMWKRYLFGNSRFMWLVIKEKFFKS